MACRNHSGLTLLEILILLLVFAGLAALVYPVVVERLDDYQVKQAEADLEALSSALEKYKLDNHFYPTTQQGLQALVAQPTSGPTPKNWNPAGYLSRGVVPLDPWGQPYRYESREDGRYYEIGTLGGDTEPGGEGVAADIKVSR